MSVSFDPSVLRTLYPFRMRLHEAGFSTREIIGPGGNFFDILLGWTDAGGNVIFNDIGGQAAPGWNPDEGHGSIWRFGRDGQLSPIVPPGNMGAYAAIHIIGDKKHFGGTDDDIFVVAQRGAGRHGATRPHVVLRVRAGNDRPEVFADIPDVGPVGGGVAGAMMPDAIGAAGSAFEGSLFVHSYMNCVVYRVPASGGKAEPFIVPDSAESAIMPYYLRHAPTWWGDLAGEMILFGIPGANFESRVVQERKTAHWRVTPAGRLDPVQPGPGPLTALRAPAAFGAFGGHLFWAEDGPVELAQIEGCDMYADGLPYSGRVMRMAPDGTVSVFADDFYGSFTSLAFDETRLVMGLCGRSYSTGEFHEPDASLYEIRFDG